MIDDNALVAESLIDILRREGFQAIAAQPSAGVEWAELMKPDVILCDVGLPEIGGVELIKKISESLPRCRIILFSGHPGIYDVLAEAHAQGRKFEFLPKPVRPEVVLSILGEPGPI